MVLFTGLVSVACEPRVTSLGAWARETPDAGIHTRARTGQYFEAEHGELSAGFVQQDDAAASAGAYVMPPADESSEDTPGAARARYAVELKAAGNYLVWGRIRGPDAEHNRFWFQVDSGAWHKWRISTGEIWFWDAVHEDADYGHALEFALARGAHELVIANCVDQVALDRLYITADGDTPPGNDTPCDPPNSIEVGGMCTPSCGSHGATTCGQAACAGKQPLAAYDCDVCCLVAP